MGTTTTTTGWDSSSTPSLDACPEVQKIADRCKREKHRQSSRQPSCVWLAQGLSSTPTCLHSFVYCVSHRAQVSYYACAYAWSRVRASIALKYFINNTTLFGNVEAVCVLIWIAKRALHSGQSGTWYLELYCCVLLLARTCVLLISCTITYVHIDSRGMYRRGYPVVPVAIGYTPIMGLNVRILFWGWQRIIS